MLRGLCIAVAVAIIASPALAARDARVYEGAGTRTLAPFSLAHGATLRWQTSGGMFGGFFTVKTLNTRADIANPQLVASRARSGTVHLGPGRYVLRITSSVRWQITIG